uniref:Uncharacterized protein n=1 Tax=viral metagenome TaxID=1070528 RepID=A0A6H2A391_9ZZZZ
MSIDWSILLTIFLAIVLATFVDRTILRAKETRVEPESTEVATTGNPITDFIRKHYPNAS